ncbi:hypothetical protein HNR26_004086 [Rhizobium rosettiformans]|uniref:Uncharacterized protein n=2 Tax=Rhizobium rosettiformans TaxID=1368430 RepID=A0A4S8PP73_9HYPH|nr:hypothetical protein [Rhizobium rosettiformans]MBB5277992.1 hypothetical protein [Rhizobium rosettiformans]THV32677.1 hypothetical protein FAA86_20220 [Rhizobium rosettiformans W3]
MSISALDDPHCKSVPEPVRDRGRLVRVVVPMAVMYNGVLAIVNAHVMPLGFSHVALVEITLLFITLLYLLYRGLSQEALPIATLVGFFALVMLYTSAANGMLFVDFFRNVLIIAVFCQLGMMTDGRSLAFVFRICCGFILSVLLVEIFFTRIYEDLFYPALYFTNTRGLEQVAFGGAKIFQNAINIPGRFSFGLSDHRTSSLFLEQVSLANFSGVLCIYLVSRFNQIPRFDRVLILATVVFILLTNDSRSMLAFSFICLFGYFLFPKISNGVRPLIMPAIIIAGALVYLMRPDASGDTFDGRIVLTMKGFFSLDFVELLALDVRNIASFADSGYIYVINASTVFGLLAFWLFVSFYPAGQGAAQKRCAFALAIFIFLNMMIGGTAIFSIKVAALLWLLVGRMRAADAEPH